MLSWYPLVRFISVANSIIGGWLYSYIRVHKPSKQSISKQIHNCAENECMNLCPSNYRVLLRHWYVSNHCCQLTISRSVTETEREWLDQVCELSNLLPLQPFSRWVRERLNFAKSQILRPQIIPACQPPAQKGSFKVMK